MSPEVKKFTGFFAYLPHRNPTNPVWNLTLLRQQPYTVIRISTVHYNLHSKI